jgi:ethanolamine utilization protein EutN
VNLGRVIGTCVATMKACGLKGQRLLLVQPLDFDLQDNGLALVAVDTVEADRGELVTFVRSREAANSLEDSFCAVDAAIVGIVDDLGMTDLSDPRGRLTFRRGGRS